MKPIKYDASLLPKMIEVSQAFNAPQKKYLLEKLDTLAETKKQKLYQVLAKEQLKQYEINKNRIALNNEFLGKKTKIVNHYNETLQNINERNVLNALDQDLANAFAS